MCTVHRTFQVVNTWQQAAAPVVFLVVGAHRHMQGRQPVQSATERFRSGFDPILYGIIVYVQLTL